MESARAVPMGLIGLYRYKFPKQPARLYGAATRNKIAISLNGIFLDINFSGIDEQLDKNKILTALKIEKEPTEEQLSASIIESEMTRLNISKEELDEKILKEEKHL